MAFGKRKKYSRFRYKSIEEAAETGSVALGSGDSGGGGATPVANAAGLSLSNLTAGDFSFDQENNRLYITNGSGWYSIALINQSPTLTANVTSVVSLGGLANTVLIGYTVVEPDGTPVDVTVSNSGIANTSQGTIVHNAANNTIEVNNFAAEGSEWSANVIISATDGVNIAVDSFTINVAYAPDPGGVLFTTTGSHSFTIPEGVIQFSAVAVGGGGGGTHYNGSGGSGGGGGALAYVNEYSCTAGEIWTVFVGSGGSRTVTTDGNAGTESYIEDPNGTKVLHAGGGTGGLVAYSFTPNAPGGAVLVGDGGGAGGLGGGRGSAADAGGGGGAGGYSGAGGAGEGYNVAGNAGSGGGGGGGGAGGSSDAAGAGGGVGLYGEGASGAGGTYGGGNGGPGGGGSGGESGSASPGSTARPSTGGIYGGGGAGAEINNEHGDGAQGAVRIIWGDQRKFPSTNVEASDTLPLGSAETTV